VIAYCGRCHLVIQEDKHIHYKQEAEDSNRGLGLNSWKFRKEKLQSSFAMIVSLSLCNISRAGKRIFSKL
jgi:hypothetical protein